MSISKTIATFSTFVQKRPLAFNCIVYGSFYTGAEFAQQSYNKRFQLDQPTAKLLSMESSIPEERTFKWMQVLNETLGLSDDETSLNDYNWPQLKRYAIYGCFLAGPVLHGWYKWLDNSYRGTSMKIVCRKLFIDQFVLTPPLITLFFVSMSLMEGRRDIFDECKAKFIKTFQTSCLYWIPVQFMNFLLVPPSFRVLYVSVAAFSWVNILCYLKRAPLVEMKEDNS